MFHDDISQYQFLGRPGFGLCHLDLMIKEITGNASCTTKETIYIGFSKGVVVLNNFIAEVATQCLELAHMLEWESADYKKMLPVGEPTYRRDGLPKNACGLPGRNSPPIFFFFLLIYLKRITP